jgi:hypothetical protein
MPLDTHLLFMYYMYIQCHMYMYIRDFSRKLDRGGGANWAFLKLRGVSDS